MFLTQETYAQASAQTINPGGGANTALTDGLKIVVNPTGTLAVFRQDYAQYCCNRAYSDVSARSGGVRLSFRFSRGATYNAASSSMTSCATTTVLQNGNTSTTSISGYVISPISSKRFYVTMNVTYVYPTKYFTVDYYVRAPYDLATAETVHMYLDHDSYILGDDGSRATINTTNGHFVGNYRTASDQGCGGGKGTNARYPSHHGFKSTSFRSYYSGPYSARNNLGTNNQLTNTYATGVCRDDGIAVEFIAGPIAAGQIKARRVLHCYGENLTDFTGLTVIDPTPAAGTSSPVAVDFTASNFYEGEGTGAHLATEAKIRVGGGVLATDQVCNFSISGGNATLNTHYSYVQGFTIPAGDYTTPKVLTLNNITLYGNDICDGTNRTFNMRINTELCNDLIQPGATHPTAVFEIIDDDAPTVNPVAPATATYCAGTAVAANTYVFTGNAMTGKSYTWTSNANVGFGTSGTGNIPAFTAANTTNAAVTATITVTPKQGSCSGNPTTFTITVNPSPVLTQPGNQTACANSNTTAVNFAGTNLNAATSTWVNNNPAIGLAASGTGNIAAFTATNTTNAAITATITVTPKSANGCNGAAKSFTITVNPSPVLTQPANQTICANTNTVAVNFAGTNLNAATCTWTNNNTAIGLGANGTGNIPVFKATNTTAAPITATITVTPKSAAGCNGIAKSFTITVNPLGRPADITTADATICYNTKATLTASSSLAGAQFKWYDTQTSTVALATAATYTSPANLVASRSYYVSVTATGVCENPTSGRKEVKVIVRPQITVGSISGNPSVCSGDAPQEIKGVASTGGSGSYTYKWESKVGAGAWTAIGGATSASYQPAALTQTTSYRRTTIDTTCGEDATKTNEFTITVVGQGVKFTWKTNAASSNWNDPANWTNTGGLTNAVPTSCSEVHIPYIAPTAVPCNYPALDATTPTNVFGEPAAGSIIFHHGGQIAYPHKLNYKKAFVQYNWKYYNNTGLTAGAQPGANSDALGSFLKRDVWNMIAAPLKGMASGDFALAGYPITWQSKFKAITTPAAGTAILGDFSNPIRDNDIDLSSTYNAVAIKVAAHKPAIGWNQQNAKGLEGLKGVLEIPYWENAAIAAFRSGHTYDPIARKSMFYYFDDKTLQQVGSPVGTMSRNDKSYRFVFEDANNNVPTIAELANVKGYTITVKPEEKGVVMIGNPFLSSINSQKFFDANSTSINRTAGYYVFSADGTKWAQYQYNSTNNVGPLQAFVVTLTNTTTAVKLFFPLEGTHALTDKGNKGSSRIAPESGSLLVSLNGSQATADDSYAILDNSTEQGNVNKILFTEGHKTPEVFFISPNSNEYNLVQTLERDENKELSLGVRSSDTNSELTLKFDNIGQFVASNGVRPVLIDKVSGRKQDLSVYNTYKFKQDKDRLDALYTDASRFEIRLMTDEDFSEDRSIIIRYFKKVLTVESMSNLKEINIHDIAGNKILQVRNGLENINFYQKDLSLSPGVYIVNVQTVDGRKMTEKIIVH